MCELCNLEKKTKWYFEDGIVIVCDCLTCKIPMIVSKEHEVDMPFLFYESHFHDLIKRIFRKKFHFRKEARKIKDHWHWHIVLEEE